jgi:tetratricopeptide (TPR) repeat protein
MVSTVAPVLAWDRDKRLDEIVVAYLEAVEAGQTLDRNEWLAREPGLAAELAEFFADQDRVKGWTGPLREVSPRLTDTVAGPETIGWDDCPQAAPGTFVGDYCLIEEIDRGGMGVVYKARQVSLQREVALKMVLAGRCGAAADLLRFRSEAEAAAHLDHPNIVPIYEVGEYRGRHFFSMKLIEGGNLKEHLARFAQDQRASARLLATVARAVHYAHQRGILHRDLKPGNILLDAKGRPHITDFGLAKRITRDPGLTDPGAVVGTPSYMAREQALGQPLTVSADVYGLGAILYELLTGRPPFRGATSFDVLQQVVEREAQRPGAFAPGIDHDLETICMKCLAREPQGRYGSADALADDLDNWLEGRPIRARRAGMGERAVKWARRRPAAAALVAVLGVTAASLATGYGWHQHGQAEQEASERRASEQRSKDVQTLLLQAQKAYALDDLLEAHNLLSRALGLIQFDPALANLQEPVESLLTTTNVRISTRAALEYAQRKYQQFLHSWDEALFRGTMLSGTEVADQRAAARNAAREALEVFALTDDSVQPLAVSPAFSEAQRGEIAEGCYELLLILAEAEAQPASREHAEEALAILQRAKRLEGLGPPPPKAYHLRRAQYLQQLGRTHEAGEASKAAEREPASAFDFFLLGYDELRQGALLEAVSQFKKALQKRPGDFWARYFLAISYLRARQPVLAKENLTGCLARRPDVAWVHMLLGLAHGELGEFADAEENAKIALGCNPDDDVRYAVLVNRGALRGGRGRCREAEEDLQQAMQLKPNRYQAYANLAKVYQRQNKFDEAVQQLDKAVELGEPLFRAGQLDAPALAVLYHNRAEIRWDQGKPDAALEDFDQAIHIAPSPEAHSERGRLLYTRERFAEAVQAYDAALKLDDLPEAHLGRARARVAEQRNFKEAAADLDCYLQRSPRDARAKDLADAYVLRGLTRAELKNYSGAINDYTVALNLRSDSVTFAYRGWVRVLGRDLSQALSDFDDAINLNEHNGDAYNGRGLVRTRLGRYQEARKDADKAARNEPVDRGEKRRWLTGRAHIFAQLVGALRYDPTLADREGLEGPAEYQTYALRLLYKALELTPREERRDFWRKNVDSDNWLAPISSSLEFARLRRQYAP